MASHGKGEHELRIVHFKGLEIQSRHHLLSSHRLAHAIQAQVLDSGGVWQCRSWLERELQIVLRTC